MESVTRAVAFKKCIKKYFLMKERPAWYPHQVIEKDSPLRDELPAKLDDNILTEDEFVAAVNDSYKLFKGLTSIDLHCVFSSLLKISADEGLKGSVDTQNEAGMIIAELNVLCEQIRSGTEEYKCRRAKTKPKLP